MSRSSVSAPSPLARYLPYAPIAIVVVVLYVLLKISASSTLGLGLAVVIAASLLMLTSLGLRGTAILMIGIGLAMAPLEEIKPVASLEFASASDVALVIGFLLLLPTLLTNRLPSEALIALGAGGLIAVAVVSTAAGADPSQGLINMLRFVVGALLTPFVFALWRPRRELVVAFAAAIIAGNAFNSIAAYWRLVGDGGRRIGYSSHPNAFGLAAMLALALVPFVLASVPRRWRWLVLVGGALCFWGIWTSGSRSALIGAIGVVVVYVLLKKSAGLAVAAFGASIPVLYIATDSILSGEDDSGNAFGRLLGGYGTSQSDAARRELVAYAWRQFLDHPVLGNGLSEVTAAHNIFLQVAASVGLVGLVFYLMILASTVLRAATLPAPFTLLMLPAVAYILIGVTTPILWDRYLWTVLALPFLVALPPRDPSPDDESPPAEHAPIPTMQELR